MTTLLYPSQTLVELVNTIRIPHPSEGVSEHEKDPKLLCLPMKFSDKALWTFEDKISLLKIRLYLHHYIKHGLMFSTRRMVVVNDVLKVLDADMEDRITYDDLIRVVSGHLYENY